MLDVDPEAVDGVLEAYGRHRLLTFDREPTTREPTVEIAHEALLTSWNRLRTWIDEAREGLRSGATGRAGRRGMAWGRARPELPAPRGSAGPGVDLGREHRPRGRLVRAGVPEGERGASRRGTCRGGGTPGPRGPGRAALTVAAPCARGGADGGRPRRERVDGDRGRTVEPSAADRSGGTRTSARLRRDREPRRGPARKASRSALQAIDATRDDGIALREAQEALHQGLQADGLLFTIEDPSTANVAWSADGRLLATGGTAGGLGTNNAVVWDARTGEEVVTLTGHEEDVYSVGFSLDWTRVVTTSDDDSAIVWDTASGEPLLTVDRQGHRWGVVQPRRSPAGRPGTGAGSVPGPRRVDGRHGPRRSGLPTVLTAVPRSARTDRRIAASGCPYADSAGRGVIWDWHPGGGWCTRARTSDWISGWVFSPDGGRLAGRTGGTAANWDARTGHELVSDLGALERSLRRLVQP